MKRFPLELSPRVVVVPHLDRRKCYGANVRRITMCIVSPRFISSIARSCQIEPLNGKNIVAKISG